MSPLEVLRSFWSAMQENDWDRAVTHLSDDCVVDWPCSGERISGRDDYARLQARYPSASGVWSFEVHRLVADDRSVVSEVTTTDGNQSARAVVISDVEDSHIVHQVEYWPTAYDALPGREDLTSSITRIP